MPRTSENQKIVNYLIKSAADNIIQDYSNFWPIMDELNEDLLVTLCCYRGSYQNVPKSLEWRSTVLQEFDESRFRQMLRVNRNQFGLLLSCISDSKEFNNWHSIRQYQVDLQLAIVLYRLGSSGENAAIRKVATIFGVGDGETIYKITKRVFRSSLELQSKYITWPDSSERQEIVGNTYHELPHCIGNIDGTELKLAEAPVLNHSVFFSKSRIYSVKAQVVCDYRMRIRHDVVGHYGSVHDARMFRTSALFTQKSNFFSGDEWLAGDSAYPLLTNLITPFRTNSQQLTSTKREAFNLRHSKFRVRIENGFGFLKERFGSLKELRTSIYNNASHNFCSKWFLVCCVMHNILQTTSENFEYVSDLLYDGEEVDEITHHENNERIREAELKRLALYDLMFD